MTQKSVFLGRNADSVNTTLGSSQFGRVNGFRDPRIIQLAAKFYF